MKNKVVLPVFIWMLIGVLCCAYFISQENKEIQNLKALEKSSNVLIHASKKVFLEELIEGEGQMEELGSNPKDVKFYGSLRNNYEFSDSLFKTDNYKWSLLKEYLRDSSYQYIISSNNKDWLTYESPNSILLHDLHKIALFRIHNQAQITEFSSITYCGFIIFDKFSLNVVTLSPKLFLHYSDNPKLFSYQLYQNNQLTDKIYFDVEKDTAIDFQIRTDYYTNDTLKSVKNYKLKVKAGQRTDFEIEEMK